MFHSVFFRAFMVSFCILALMQPALSVAANNFADIVLNPPPTGGVTVQNGSGSAVFRVDRDTGSVTIPALPAANNNSTGLTCFGSDGKLLPCPPSTGSLSVYDANNNNMGKLISFNPITTLTPQGYFLSFAAGPLPLTFGIQDASLLFSSNNCTGTPYTKYYMNNINFNGPFFSVYFNTFYIPASTDSDGSGANSALFSDVNPLSTTYGSSCVIITDSEKSFFAAAVITPVKAISAASLGLTGSSTSVGFQIATPIAIK